MKEKTLGRWLGMGLILAGACFLISPMMAIVDVLPDFIGYALILGGVYRLADLEERIEEASRLFRRLVILGLVRMALIFFVYGMSSPEEQPTLQLLCSFVLATLDCMALIPAWKKLGAGLIYLATRHDGRAVFDKKYPGSRKKIYESSRTLTEKTTSFTVFFLVTREVLSVLPEFAVLSHEKGGAEAGTGTMLYEYIGFMRQICGMVVLVLGIIWLIQFIRYARHLARDTAFFDTLREKYEREVLTRPELFARRGVKRALVFMCAALIFSVDFFLDDVCITPDFLMGILLLVGLLLLRKYTKGETWRVAAVATVAYIPISAIEWLLQMSYLNLTDTRWAYRDADIYDRWTVMLLVRLVSLAAGLLVLFLILRVLKNVIRQYTGFSVTARDSAEPNARVAETHRALTRGLWIAFGGAVVAAVSSVVYLYTLPVASGTLWEVWIFVDALAPIISAALFIYATAQIFRQIDYKYMLS